jgi:diguanylate cyclase (GGDEF)-like protein
LRGGREAGGGPRAQGAADGAAGRPAGGRLDAQAAGGFLAILLVTAVLVGLVIVESERRMELAAATYVRNSAEQARLSLRPVEQLFEHVYEDLRTLAALPSVRAVDRHGASLLGDSRETFQQIYNNLANAVEVSEVYLIPGDFDPERIDPVTGKPEEPIVMFDELIVDAAAKVDEKLRGSLASDAHEEIEIHEYREFARQARWMREHYPRRESIKGMNVPIVGSHSVITCDNRYFMHSGSDADRMGILLSVPFYGPDGAFKGLVAAIVLDRALAAALPARNAVLRNAAYGYVLPTDVGQIEASRPHFEAGRPDPELLFSASYGIGVPDPRGEWTVWVARSDADFHQSTEARAARAFQVTGLAIAAALALVAGAIWVQFLREKGAAARQARELADKVAARTDEIARLALTDPLTDLPNRARMQSVLEQLEGRLPALGACAVMCVDLDRLKLINDTLGHRAGDAYLVAAACRMRAAVGAWGTVARWGGDEFVITLEGREAAARAGQIAREILGALAEPVRIDGHTLVPGGSIGIAEGPRDGTAGVELLTRADRALYRVKANGRGHAMHFDVSLDERYSERCQLELDLRVAVDARQFVLHYQPVVDALSGRLAGFEALVRWEHPTRGVVLPAEFIPIAEETGLIVEIGELVLAQACRAAAAWPQGLRVAVNLSPVQVRQEGLPRRVAAILDACGLGADRLELEVTESVFLAADPATLERIGKIRASGVRFALDDFGTGYCSLGYLHAVAFDRIKIDRSFVADLGHRPSCLPIIRAVTQLAAGMGMQTTAEGVETREQAELLVAHGVTDLQGFLIGAPQPEAAARALAFSAPVLAPEPAAAPARGAADRVREGSGPLRDRPRQSATASGD